MALAYTALFHPSEDGSEIGVTFPDLPGCVSSGDTIVQALAGAREALAGHVAAMLADGEALPAPRPLKELLRDAEVAADIEAGATLAPVPVIDVAPPKERINVMMDPGILRQLDDEARSQGVSRSALLEQAAGTMLGLGQNRAARAARQASARAETGRYSPLARRGS